MKRKKILILGAAGRDFHNFNVVYRDNEAYEVVAFTATQIPDIEGRRYPASMAGKLYPEGIPIYAEEEMTSLIEKHKVDECVFAYSDVSHQYVMSLAAKVQAAGASFVLLGTKQTMLKSTKPVIAVCAARTGVGKSQTARRVIEILLKKGLKVVAVRHPMPYGGDIAEQKVQRFAEIADLGKHHCTIEEMEEYEPHIARGNVIYSGADYEAILRAAEKDPRGCDVIIWDGGNNDFSFFEADLYMTLVDPHRPGHELTYYPSQVSMLISDVVIINKIDSASPDSVQILRDNIERYNPKATVVEAASPIRVAKPELLKGKRVLVVEDGPTLTHGGMTIGAGTIAAKKFGAAELVDPRPWITGKIVETFEHYPGIGQLLPAMGYSDQQLHDLETTINHCDCDAVAIGTPIDLGRILKINKPHTRVFYDLQEIGEPNLDQILTDFVERKVKK